MQMLNKLLLKRRTWGVIPVHAFVLFCFLVILSIRNGAEKLEFTQNSFHPLLHL